MPDPGSFAASQSAQTFPTDPSPQGHGAVPWNAVERVVNCIERLEKHDEPTEAETSTSARVERALALVTGLVRMWWHLPKALRTRPRRVLGYNQGYPANCAPRCGGPRSSSFQSRCNPEHLAIKPKPQERIKISPLDCFGFEVLRYMFFQVVLIHESQP